MKLPPIFIRGAMNVMAKGGLIKRTDDEEESYMLAVNPRKMKLADALKTLRRQGDVDYDVMPHITVDQVRPIMDNITHSFRKSKGGS